MFATTTITAAREQIVSFSTPFFFDATRLRCTAYPRPAPVARCSANARPCT